MADVRMLLGTGRGEIQLLTELLQCSLGCPGAAFLPCFLARDPWIMIRLD
jgi:hypothetical protein